MLLSFGGAILPIEIEDYERDIRKGNGLIDNFVSFRAPMHGEKQLTLEEKVELLGRKLRSRMARKVPRPDLTGTLAMGLSGMAALLAGAHGAMGMVEQGGVLPWYCTCRWWMHLWYILLNSIQIQYLHSEAESLCLHHWARQPCSRCWIYRLRDFNLCRWYLLGYSWLKGSPSCQSK